MLIPPWNGAEYQYVGWIPNTLGHISFSRIGQDTNPSANAGPRTGPGGEQHVILHQIREADDYALPNWIMKYFKAGVVHDWVLVGSASRAQYPSCKNIPATTAVIDERGMLFGSIYTIGDPGLVGVFDSRRRAFERQLGRFRREIGELIRIARDKRDDPEDPTAQVGEAMALVERYRAEGLGISRIKFALMRTGEARFWVESLTPGWTAESFHSTVSVAYLFLKDVAHRHEHHHHSQDSMLPLTRIGDEEMAWQRQSLWALSRSIEDNVRQGKRKTLRAALGMIPYAENFHAMYSGLKRDPATEMGFSPIKNPDHYVFEPMRKSVATLLDSKSWWLAMATAIVGSVMAISLSSVIAISNLAEKKAHWPDWLLWFAKMHPIWTMVIVFAALWMAYEFVYRETLADRWYFVPMRFVTRLVKAIGVSLRRRFRLHRRTGPWVTGLMQLTVVASSLALIAWLIGLFG